MRIAKDLIFKNLSKAIPAYAAKRNTISKISKEGMKHHE